jgi:hypothetical protein
MNERRFSWALLIGCCVIALAILDAGVRISRRIPHTMQGNFHGALHGAGGFAEVGEFMSDWQAASFLLMEYDTFLQLLQEGEFGGTYTVFRVEQRQWRRAVFEEHVREAEEAGRPIPVTPVPTEYDIVIVDHRIFSRARLTEWLEDRIGGI